MNEATRNEVVRRHQAGASIRAIARDLGLARNTVRGVLAAVQAARAGEGTPTPIRRPSLLDPYAATIDELLGRYPELTAMRLFEELRARGFAGGYTIVRRLLKQRRPRATPTPVIRFETAPGAQAQMDYASYDLDFTDEGRRRVQLFSYVLGYSRRQYLCFVEAQDFTTTVRQHVQAFTHLGGVAAACLYDNFKVVVSGYDGDVPVYNPRFLAFATHYGFRPVACRVRRPQTKGKVERPFHYVETSLLCGRTFRSLADLNEVTAWWLQHVADVRIHRETRETPLARHAAEVPHLIALPAVPYETALVIYRTVNVEGVIAYRQNHYSVPWRYIGQLVPVRITETDVIIYDPDLHEVARHRLLPRGAVGRRCVRPQDQPALDVQQRQALLRERFAELGPAASRFLDGLLQAQRYGRDQAQRVLGLLGSYARSDVVAALERAVRYGAYSLAAVERILAAQARPKSLVQTLAEAERQPLPRALAAGAVPPRPTADYQPLLTKEPDHGRPPETPGESAGGDGPA